MDPQVKLLPEARLDFSLAGLCVAFLTCSAYALEVLGLLVGLMVGAIVCLLVGLTISS